MEVCLSSEREPFVRRLVDSGRYASPDEVVEAALRLFEGRETTCPRRRAVALGLEQALAGRSAAVTSDELVRLANRRESLR